MRLPMLWLFLRSFLFYILVKPYWNKINVHPITCSWSTDILLIIIIIILDCNKQGVYSFPPNTLEKGS